MRWLMPLLLATAACTPAAEGNAAQAAPARTEGTLIVGNKGEDTVSFIDLASGTECARVETGSQPHEIALSPDGRRAAVVAYGATTIDIFDVASAARVKRIDLAPNARPHGIVWTSDGRLIATTEGSATLTLVDPESGAVDAIPTDQDISHMVAVSGDLTRAYVANMGSGTVSVIDLESGEKLRDLEAGETPEGLALSPDGTRLWVADRANGRLTVFDTERLEGLSSVDVGNFPIRVAVTPDGGTVIVSNAMDGTLSLVDAETLDVRTIAVSGEGLAMQVTILLGSDGRTLYAAETGRQQVAVVDLETGEVLRRYQAGEGSDGLGISAIRTRCD
ncbi:MAG: YncE family protein [Parasphingopyxis sp.]|nr:YncE family protein [Sphingomonadales bacterium]